MIKIEVSNPSECKPAELKLVIEMLQRFAGIVVAPVYPENASATIAPADNPATGSPDAREAFSGAAAQSTLDPAIAFGAAAPVVAAGFTTDPAPVPNVPAVPSPTATGTGVAAVPAQNTNPAPVPNGSSVDLDADGLPWDARIHSSSKEKNKTDSKWRAKRGVDANTVAQVVAELRALMGAPAGNVAGSPVAPVPAAPVVAPPPPVAHVAPVEAVPVPNVPAAAQPQVQPGVSLNAPGTASPTIATGAPAPIDYQTLAGRIAAAMGSGALTMDRITAACSARQVAAFPLLVSRPDLVPLVAADLGLV